MILLHAHDAARDAVAANPTRPAMATVHAATGVRLVVFRLEPGQRVAPHVSEMTVVLAVLSGRGVLSGADGETEAGPGAVAIFEPGELHGMRAGGERFSLLATIVRKH